MEQFDFRRMSIYQIWVRSFCDGNGDGIGDLYGVYEQSVENVSAYEIINEVNELEEEEKRKAEEEKEKEKEKEKAAKEKEKAASKKKTQSAVGKVASSTMNSIGREIGKSLSRGLLGTLKKWIK